MMHIRPPPWPAPGRQSPGRTVQRDCEESWHMTRVREAINLSNESLTSAPSHPAAMATMPFPTVASENV
eukprot:768278-Hanusia_phi.AAC.3